MRDEPDKPIPRPLSGRYELIRRVRGTARGIVWLARDAVTGARVVASIVPGPRGAALEPAVGLEHPNAATLLSVLEAPAPGELPGDEPVPPEARVAVAAYVEGGSLQQRLDTGPVPVESAVDWIATVAEVLSILHDRAAVHGAVSPRSVIVARPDRGAVPVLAQLLSSPSGAYCSPERVTGGGPSESDDTWALSATLYTALSRRAPFQGTTRTELARAIVRGSPEPLTQVDARLGAILSRALTADPRRRFENAAAFGAALRTWMKDTGAVNAGDFEPVPALVGAADRAPLVGDLSVVAAYVRPDTAEALAPLGSPAEPLDELARAQRWDEAVPASPRPMSSAPPKPVVKEASPSPAALDPSRRRWRPLALAATLAGAAALSGAAGLLAGRWMHATAPKEPPEAAASSTPPRPEETSTSMVIPAPSATPSPVFENAGACVRGTLPEGMFGTDASFEFLCKGTDLWGATRKMNSRVGTGARGKGLITWASLGRYDLAAVAILRERCCPAAPPVAVATPNGICASLADDVRALAKAPRSEQTNRYAADIDCLLSRGFRYPADYWDRVGPKDARADFETFLASLHARSGPPDSALSSPTPSRPPSPGR